MICHDSYVTSLQYDWHSHYDTEKSFRYIVIILNAGV